jgi:hypothetical protein
MKLTIATGPVIALVRVRISDYGSRPNGRTKQNTPVCSGVQAGERRGDQAESVPIAAAVDPDCVFECARHAVEELRISQTTSARLKVR